VRRTNDPGDVAARTRRPPARARFNNFLLLAGRVLLSILFLVRFHPNMRAVLKIEP